ncbi:hypothetical protein Q1695_000327 [Nippostrongylus brasiliensis]|nr:hypothetical protein Q1695_000327 [Nippostrongylus brasiliensis]
MLLKFHSKKIIFVVCCISTALVVFLLYFFFTPNYEESDGRLNSKQAFVVRDAPVVIYQAPDFTAHLHYGSAVFHKYGCQIRNCILTSSDESKRTADVVIFGENSEWEPPSTRRADQLWIVRLLESPENTRSLKRYENQVNATVSYRPDSDVQIAYGKYQKFLIEQNRSREINYAEGKTRMVCWIVSNCFTNNRRMEYARRLAKLIQVDIYGACGTNILGKQQAYQLIREKCKFYLAFENSNCRHYITEKFWINALQNNAIPIVMGAPKRDYADVAPPNSFIHVEDYTIEHLSSYLHYLDRNDTAYNEYFAWKKYGRVVDSNFYCHLCAFVQLPPTKTYTDLDKWWRGRNECEVYSVAKPGFSHK